MNYEIELIEPDQNRFSVWVSVEMNATNSFTAHWGDPNLKDSAPDYAIDGSTWSNGFMGVWHYRPMTLTTTLTDSTYYRNHMYDDFGVTALEGALSGGRAMNGGPDSIFRVPGHILWMNWIKMDSHLRLDQYGEFA